MTETFGLRHRLRAELQHDHQTLDDLVSKFDLGTRDGMRRFLQTQEAGLRCVAGACGTSASHAAARTLAERAAQDLQALQAPRLAVDLVSPSNQTAIDYIVGGAQMGTAVLKSRWQSATDPTLGTVDRYFSAPSYAQIWRDFCASAKTLPATGAAADAVVDAARQMFGQFTIAAQNATGSHPERHIT